MIFSSASLSYPLKFNFLLPKPGDHTMCPAAFPRTAGIIGLMSPVQAESKDDSLLAAVHGFFGGEKK